MAHAAVKRDGQQTRLQTSRVTNSCVLERPTAHRYSRTNILYGARFSCTLASFALQLTQHILSHAGVCCVNKAHAALCCAALCPVLLSGSTCTGPFRPEARRAVPGSDAGRPDAAGGHQAPAAPVTLQTHRVLNLSTLRLDCHHSVCCRPLPAPDACLCWLHVQPWPARFSVSCCRSRFGCCAWLCCAGAADRLLVGTAGEGGRCVCLCVTHGAGEPHTSASCVLHTPEACRPHCGLSSCTATSCLAADLVRLQCSVGADRRGWRLQW